MIIVLVSNSDECLDSRTRTEHVFKSSAFLRVVRILSLQRAHELEPDLEGARGFKCASLRLTAGAADRIC